MLDAIVSEHNMSSLFWNLPLCFFNRNEEGLRLEEVFSVPYTESRRGPVIGKVILTEDKVRGVPETNMSK